MIYAEFYFKDDDTPVGFKVSGHAGWAESGSDIVCAAVSSAVELTCNTVTDFFGFDCYVGVNGEYNSIELYLPEYTPKIPDYAVKLVCSLKSHLEHISEDYPGTVEVSVAPRKGKPEKRRFKK
ncbi:MAG: ribosomal-processing cysteine protease Prp [Oscillospiraceae bacterium]|jgi:uncharacterized protein YsxB (DUF464 family)|nr:ribosomal-processing cysteine protease Prp [Oscillospiraceae bacterium]